MVSIFSLVQPPGIQQAKKAFSIAFICSLCFFSTPAVLSDSKITVKTAKNYYDKKQYKEANVLLNNYLKHHPRDKRALYIRSRCHEALAHDKLAILDLTKLIDMKHREVKYRRKRGELYINCGQADKAVSDLAFATKAHPKDYDIWSQLGLAYRITNNKEKAIHCYSKMIELKPHRAKPYNLRARTYQVDKQYRKAIKDYTKSLSLKSTKTNPRLQRGICYFYIGEFSKSEVDFSRAIELGHRSVEPLLMRARVYDKLGKKKLAEKDRKAARVDDFEIPYHGK